MPSERVEDGAYRIEAVQPEHIESIRLWRNQQMDVLRQAEVIAPQQQINYYDKHIWPTMKNPQPTNVLVSYFESDRLVGYGGLVHIAWDDSVAEVSFLLAPRHLNPPETYRRYHLGFLQLIKQLAFDELGLEHLTTETYSQRLAHIENLEIADFRRTDFVANPAVIDKVVADSIMHRCSRPKETM